MSRIDCPDVRNWQELLAGERRDREAEGLTRHLETCDNCQHTLESLAAAPAVWEDTACALGEQRRKAAREPALLHVVERLKEETFSAGEADLSFLQPADDPELLGLLDSYQVQEVIGRGGMGVVLKAFDPVLHRLVAIKVLDPALADNATARRRFTRETQAAAAVCHEHVVAVHGVSEASGLPYLVMQYVAGESLQTRLDREGPLEATDVVRLGMQTASGLAAAHVQGLIHRDIKPANLLLENGLIRVKITDFGLARMSDDVGLTQNGVIAGTPEYMAPEQARGEGVDHRADLFSLGSVLYACCAGSPPFRGATVLAVLAQVCEKELLPLRSRNADVPAWLEAFIARLMAKDPAQRFQSAAEASALLEDYLGHLRQPATVSVPELPPSSRIGSLEGSFPKSRMASVKRFARFLWLPLFVGLMVLGLSIFPLAQVVPPEQPTPNREPAVRQFYQDFRGSQPLHPSLILFGPDAEEVSRFEAEGLRITLPATRPVNQPVELATSFALSGDFEVTGTYELLSASRPDQGYGVGVGLNIADSDARNEFAKIARCTLAKEGSVFRTEYWVKEPKHDWQGRSKPTASRLGQLRLVRKGTLLRCLAADGLGGDFQEIFSKDSFGTEDMAHVHFAVTDSGRPGNTVDVRLIDLKIRAAKLIPDPGDTNLVPAAASPSAPASEPRRKSGSLKWLVALAIMVLLVLASLVVCLVVRRLRRPGSSLSADPVLEEASEARTAAAPISLRCSGCAKTLKVKAALAGKKVKCPQCGQSVLVTAIKTDDSPTTPLRGRDNAPA